MNTFTLLAPVLAMSSMLNVCTNRPEIWSELKQAVMQEEILISNMPSLGTTPEYKERRYILKQGDESTKKQREYLLNILEQGRFRDDIYNHDKSLVIEIGPFFKDGSSLKISFPKSQLKGRYALECQPYDKRKECINVFFPTPSATSKP
ncbi:MAG: hypothetical protein R3Y56_10365 [Akkermansia sp.]